MKFINKLILKLIFMIIVTNIFSFNQDIFADNKSNYKANYKAIELLVKKFNRDITFLEITKSSDSYALKLSKKFNGVFIVLLLNGKSDKIVSKIKDQNLTNVIILEPKNISPENIETLSRCEHFDIVIANGVTRFFGNLSDDLNIIDSVLNLGDFVYFKDQWVNTSDLINSNKGPINTINYDDKYMLSMFKASKKGLEIARFSQRNKPKNSSYVYQIMSNFDEKYFYKESLEKPLSWISGINLITFVMLRGVYPNDRIISTEIRKMRDLNSYHNDLMIGNMIIKGEKIVPIDFKDKRRNASMIKCIEKALKVFNGDNARLKNPFLTVQNYYKY